MLPFSSKPVRSSSDFENEMSLGTILIQSFIKTKSKSHLWPLNSAAQELKVVCPSHVPTHVFHSKLFLTLLPPLLASATIICMFHPLSLCGRKIKMELVLPRELSKWSWEATAEVWLTHILSWMESDLLVTYCPNEGIQNICQKLKILIRPLS